MALKRVFSVLALFLVGLQAHASLNFDFRKNTAYNESRSDGYELVTGFRIPISFSHNSNKLGFTDGNYFDFSGKLKAALYYKKNHHHWDTLFFLEEAFSVNPAIKNHFLKSRDTLRLETRYIYDLEKWVSLFGHMKFETSLFESSRHHPQKRKYEFRDIDDNTKETRETASVKISDPFRPVFLQESLGALFTPYQSEHFTFEGKAGIGFRQTFADGQKIFVEEKEDLNVVRDLHNFYEIGPLFGGDVEGSFYNNKFTYSAGVEVFIPVFESPKSKDQTLINMLSIDAFAGLGVRLNNWSSLEYKYTLSRTPHILDKFQQQHSLNFNIGFDWFHKFG